MSDDTITLATARAAFEAAAANIPPAPPYSGSGIVICAGGPFVPSAYTVVRLLRDKGVTLPIEIWYAGPDEMPDWAAMAFEPWNVALNDVTPYYPGRPVKELRGWPIKPAALMSSRFRHVLFLDADCFPLRDLSFILESKEYESHGALFWPDNKHYKMTEEGTIWDLTGIAYRGDTEFETGIFALDKVRHWRSFYMTQWLNNHSTFWYDHVMGDKDTFYLGLRAFDAPYLLAPPCKRYNAIVTRHFWHDGTPLVDHRTGTSKYSLPRRKGPVSLYLAPYKHRSQKKNIYDELMQRFIIREFRQHIVFLRELGDVHARWLKEQDGARQSAA